jgi:hypothetical protein
MGLMDTAYTVFPLEREHVHSSTLNLSMFGVDVLRICQLPRIRGHGRPRLVSLNNFPSMVWINNIIYRRLYEG